MKKGFSIIEIVLATAILSLIVVGVTSAWLYGEEAVVKGGDRNRAVLLASEAVDIVRNIRDTTDLGFIADGAYGFSQTVNGWALQPSSTVETIGVYTRSLVVTSPSDSQKNFTVTVSWPSIGDRQETVSFSSILTNWRTYGGYPAIFGGGGGGGGGAPSLSTSGGGGSLSADQYRLEVRPDTGTARDHLYSINSAEGSVSIITVDSDESVNVDAGLLSADDFRGNTPTNIFVSHDYLYVTTNNLANSLYVFSLDDPTSPVHVGTYDATGITNSSAALSVFVTNDGTSDQTAYIGYTRSGTMSELIAVDVTNPATPETLGSIAINKSIGDIFVDSSNVAHTAAVNKEGLLFYVSFDVATPADPSLLDDLEIPMSFDVALIDLLYRQISISVSGTTGYIGAGNATAMVNATNPASLELSSAANDTLSYYFALNWRSGYTFAVGDVQMSTFYPSSGVTIVNSNLLNNMPGVAVVYSSNLDFVYTIERNDFYVYTVD